jgi:kanamycin kinase
VSKVLYSGVPGGDTVVPGAVLDFAAGDPLTPIWLNEAGGLTYRVGRSSGDVFVKWDPAGSIESLAHERERLEWLAGRFPAPRVVGFGADESGDWLATAALDAESAVSPRWKAEPATAVRAIAAGLRLLHGTLDAASAPFSWSVDTRVRAAAANGVEVADALRTAPPIDRLVVCHGDPCVPNTLLGASGRFAAIVDAGRVGAADRWADLAVASMSLGWNFGAGWEPLFFDTYGVERDEERIAYYRALWDAT